MKSIRLYLGILAIASFMLICGIVSAADVPTPMPAHSKEEDDHIRHLLQQIVDVNQRFKDRFHSILSESSLEQQTPHATLVLCSDSRVDTDIVSETPTGEMFVIRNIGNQIDTAKGSVEYGVNNLKTQLLLVVGHSRCGAVMAAMKDYSDASVDIKKELDTIDIDKHATLNENLVRNVNKQVKDAMIELEEKVATGEIVIIGMIYDMHNDFGQGDGQLILVNINNETDPSKLANDKYIKGLKNLNILNSK